MDEKRVVDIDLEGVSSSKPSAEEGCHFDFHLLRSTFGFDQKIFPSEDMILHSFPSFSSCSPQRLPPCPCSSGPITPA
jgi:hypothetical protein